MEFKSFLVLRDKPDCYDGETEEVTVKGQQIFNIGNLVPIIQSGKGCVGNALIKQITINETTTTVTYIYSEVGKDLAKAYYSLYRNDVSMQRNSGSSDIYDNDDMIIPGAFGRSVEPKPAKGRERRGSGFNLSDYL